MKYRYAVDNDNRLLIKPPRSKKTLMPKGRFAINKKNELSYSVNEPSSWRRLYHLGSKITFKGRWQINHNHDLELLLDESREQCGKDRLTLKGEIISGAKDSLAFAMVSRSRTTAFQILALSGSWLADEYNRLSFRVKKTGSPDTLTLEAAWQVHKNQQITYKYEKINLKTRERSLKTLTFEGYWDITSSDRLSYVLSGSSESRFDFGIRFGSPNLYPKRGTLKYQIGLGARGGPVQRVIYLHGTWKFNRRLGLALEMDYGQGRIKAIEFGAEVALSRKDKFSFALTNRRGEPLGLSLTFTHAFLRQLDAQAFLRLKGKLSEAPSVETGLTIPF